MATATDVSSSTDTLHDPAGLYRTLLLPRVIEEKMLRLIRQNRISKWFSGYGQEAIAVGCAWALRDDDYLLPTHRNLGLWTTRGVPLKPLFCQLMGKEGGYTKGRDRTFHFGLPEKRIVGMISHMAAMLPVATGLGLAAQLKGDDHVALAFCGDGASREGDFHEALSLAGVWKLPVVFVVENNGYGLSTPTETAIAARDLADAGAGYAIRSEIVDGNDLPAVLAAVQAAADRARAGEGPTLLEMKTFRMRGHEEASGTKYVPQEKMDAWADKDPIARFEAWLDAHTDIDAAARALVRTELEAEVDEAAEFALAQSDVVSTLDAERGDLFAPSTALPDVPTDETTVRRFIDAVHDGLHQAFEADDRVLMLGQDIGHYGGVFKASEGLLEKYGADRVCDTPIIESGVVGMALGLALEGYRPIVEMQYADFATCAFNQMVNNLATTHYRWGAPVNVTIRMPFGGHIGAGPFHSQSPEAWYAHAPGLKVVVPATPADAKGLLLAAVRDPNPVVLFEHKYLYRATRGDVPTAPVPTPIGQARIAREGTEATIVTWGIGVLWAEEEAAYWAEEGRSVEVVDLRTLIPWDRQTVLASLAKTNRLCVLHEATRTAGFGAEIAAQLTEEAFESLDAPPVRVASEDLPVPFSTQIEKEIFTAQARLRPAMQKLLAY